MNSGLVCVGLTTLDIVAGPIDELTHTERARLIDGIACAPAGTAAGAALVAAKLGMAVKLVGAVGDDMIGGFVRLGLEQVGVDVSLLAVQPGQKTSTTLLTVESDGRRSSYHMPGAGIAARIDDATLAAATTARFVHYAAVGGRLSDGGPGEALLRAAKEAGAIVTCDLIGPRRTAADEIARLLPHVDYFMPSAAEAVVLSGTEDLAEAAQRFLGLGAGACIIKNGRHGALVWLNGEHYAAPAYAVTPKDTTSCGDAFCAGFIAALDRGWAPKDACGFANATAGLVAEGYGTLGALAGFDETVEAMSRYAVVEDAAPVAE
ncbi:MAG TPA: carbohydrate kinase family protein [Caulobacteraceae bacterium]|nr:carbohydrate kinase family protein [Caulobacteraceae bacterium]